MSPEKRPSLFSVNDVAKLAVGIAEDSLTRAEQCDIGVAVRRLGFRKIRLMVCGVRSYAYEPTARLRNRLWNADAVSLRDLCAGAS